MQVKITAEPGSTRENKTGSWRTEKRPRYLQKNCIACRMCLLICPEGVVTGKARNSFAVDYAYCKGCGLCAQVCPKDDIEMVPEHGAESKT